jgi:N-acetylglutamate synthase
MSLDFGPAMAGEIPYEEVVSTWRGALGHGASLWAGNGRVEVEPHRWLAFSGAKSLDYNLIVCHGPDPDDLRRSINDVTAAKVPAVIMLGGKALGWSNLLAAEGWVCIGATPIEVMTDLGVTAIDPDVRIVRPEELPVAQEMLSTAFNIPPALARVALPAATAENPRREVWGLFVGGEMVTCLGCVDVGNCLAMWSLATPPQHRRHGYGGRLTTGVVACKRDEGLIDTAMFWASPDGESLYRKIGFTVVEYLQKWTRPRWAFPPV